MRRHMMVGFIVVCAAAVGTLTALAAPQTPGAAPLQVAPLASPAAAAGSFLPQMTTSDRGILLSWVERAGKQATLKFAERTPSGWTAARTVAAGDNWFVNWADVPSVVRLPGGALAAHWLQKSGASTYAYDVMLSRSTDGGATWSAPFSPHHDGTKTEHGFASLFAMPGGGLGLVWLDGRAMSTEPAMVGMDHGGGDMTVRFAAYDGTWKQTADMLVDARVCECCPTTVAVTAEGVITAFRNRSDAEVRDIHVARLTGGRWSEPQAAHADNWKIDACPVNGPSLSARGRNVVLAWFTGVNNQNHAHVAFSKDAGKTFGDAMPLDDGKTLGRVDVELLADGSALAAWIESAASGAELRVRRVWPSGQRSPAVTVAPMSNTRSSGYPRMAVSGDEVVFAWTDVVAGQAASADGGVRLKTASAKLPK